MTSAFTVFMLSFDVPLAKISSFECVAPMRLNWKSIGLKVKEIKLVQGQKSK